MHKFKVSSMLLAGIMAILAMSLACGAAPTATPVPKATSVPAASPTAAPKATAVSPQPTATAPPAATVTAQVKPVYGGTLRYVLSTGIKTLDPLHRVDKKERAVGHSIYNGLVKQDPAMNIIPDLALKWDISTDGKTITFHLAKGVKFHDGTDFNAKAAKWNFDKILDPNWVSTSRADLVAAVDKVEVLDDQTLVMKLKLAWRPILATLSLTDNLMISPTAYDKYGDFFGQRPVGTGPFVFKEWLADSRIIITKNDKYWENGVPYLDAIYYLMAADKAVQMAMLRTGEADLVDDMAAIDVVAVKGNPKIKIESLVTNSWENTFFRITQAPYNNKALRQAISYALDKQKLVDVQWEGNASPAYTTYGYSWWSDPTYQPYKYDTKKAKEKLIEAGYPQGLTVPYWCQGTDDELRECEIVQAILAESGIKVDIKLVSSADWSKIREADCGWCRMSISVRPDPDYIHRTTLHSTGGVAKNRAKYSNPQVDKLVDEAAATFDTTKAGQLYIQAQKIVFEEAVYIGFYFPTRYATRTTKVQNWVWWPDVNLRLYTLWLEK